MALEIKSLGRASEKWKRQSAAATPEFETGVRETKKDWAQNTLDANENYKTQIAKSIANDSFAKGVAKAGTDTWRTNTLTKGPQRWAAGIAGATQKYEAGFAPFRDVIANLTLTPRGPKGSQQNLQRVAEVTNALHEKKVQLAG